MPKTPDEIKKGLRCPAWVRNHHLPCSECDYHGQDKPPCAIAVHEDAIAIIQQLQAENTEQTERIRQLESRVKQLEAERDAAVADMTKIVQKYSESYCEYCHNWRGNTCPPYCRTNSEGFRWRGVQKEE